MHDMVLENTEVSQYVPDQVKQEVLQRSKEATKPIVGAIFLDKINRLLNNVSVLLGKKPEQNTTDNLILGQQPTSTTTFLGVDEEHATDIGKTVNSTGELSTSGRYSTSTSPSIESNYVSSPNLVGQGKSGLAVAREFVAKKEGFRTKAYQDSGGVWTIGYGFTTIDGKKVKPGDTITKDQANREFEKQLASYQTWKKYIKVQLTPDQEAALTSFEYNLGKGIRKKSAMNVLEKINAGDISGAVEIMKGYNTAKGKVLKGLVTRRQEEANMLQMDPSDNRGLA